MCKAEFKNAKGLVFLLFSYEKKMVDSGAREVGSKESDDGFRR
jgi:hypothetical protein